MIQFKPNSKVSHGESILHEMLQSLLAGECRRNYRPSWLMGLELDFFYPELNLAVEFNGAQHFCPTSFSTSWKSQSRRDIQKKAACKRRGISFVSIEAIDLMMGTLRRKLKNVGIKKRDMMPQKRLHHNLDRQATEYRNILRDKYNDPTAMRRGCSRREKALSDARRTTPEGIAHEERRAKRKAAKKANHEAKKIARRARLKPTQKQPISG